MAELDFDGRKWDVPDVPAALVQSLSQAIGAGLLTPTVLVSRGLHSPAEARRFLESSVSDLHDPFLLPDMRPAVARLRQALEAGERDASHLLVRMYATTSLIDSRRAMVSVRNQSGVLQGRAPV